MHDHGMTRRQLIKGVLVTGSLAAAGGFIGRTSASELKPLDPGSPAARAFAFVPDAAQVDAVVHKTFKPGQRCASCSQYAGAPSAATAGCTIFGGQSVPAGGWCKVWSPRPG